MYSLKRCLSNGWEQTAVIGETDQCWPSSRINLWQKLAPVSLIATLNILTHNFLPDFHLEIYFLHRTSCH